MTAGLFAGWWDRSSVLENALSKEEAAGYWTDRSYSFIQWNLVAGMQRDINIHSSLFEQQAPLHFKILRWSSFGATTIKPHENTAFMPMHAYTVHPRSLVHECFINIDQQWGMILWYLKYFCMFFQNGRQMQRIIAILQTFYWTEAKHTNRTAITHSALL